MGTMGSVPGPPSGPAVSNFAPVTYEIRLGVAPE